MPPKPLAIADIEWTPQIGLSFRSSDEVEAPKGIIGQRRALDAMHFGLDMGSFGYNLFVMGEGGSGRRRLVRRLLDEAASQRQVPPDWCYVDHFVDQRTPRAIELPPGRGIQLRDRMSGFVSALQDGLRNAFTGEQYRSLQQMIEEEFREKNEQALQEVEEHAKTLSLALVRTPQGFTFAPMQDGKVLEPDVFQKLPQQTQDSIVANIKRMESELQRALRQVPNWAYAARERVRDLNQRTAAYAADFLLDGLRKEFADVDEIQIYLNELRADILENVDLIISALGAPKASSLEELINGHPFYRRYLVNLIVDNSEAHEAPVVFEDEPSVDRLIGKIEHRAEQGALQTDFHLIRAGSLHRANGGYLIVDARKLLTWPGSWESLKRTIFARQVRIEPLAQTLGLISTVTLEPEPIGIDVKLVLIGDRNIYYLLAALDPEFSQLFKVAVDFSDVLKVENGDGDEYVRLVAAMAREFKLMPFSRDGIGEVLKFAARRAGDRERYTMQLLKVQDLLREASHHAKRREASLVEAEDVATAVHNQLDRLGRIPELVRETINEGTIAIDTEGEVVGQINGLSISQLGEVSFGRPSRITARIGLGRGEFVDIEREVEMGGPTHSKGVLILASFLRSTFGYARPLSLRASLVFEQSYGGVDGDSASMAEACALVSAIADVPIRQDFAMTGSMNQLGIAQAIGGVNEKIEGYFEVCVARGLTGKQGVIIPETNKRHLVLANHVIDAIRDGKFALYSVSDIREALELLTGMTVGEPGADGSYPEDTLFGKVERRLADLDQRRRAAEIRAMGERDGH